MNSISSLKSITALLPGVWSFVPRVYEGVQSNDYAELKRADGLTLGLSANSYGNKDKIIIHMSGMRDAKGERISVYAKAPASGEISPPSIKVSEAKTVEQIAGDIMRRLLPDAESYFKQASEIIAAHNAHYDGKLATLTEICARIGCEVPTEYNRREARYSVPLGDFERLGYGEVKVSGADSVEIELKSMSKANALKVIETLKALGVFNTERARR